MHVIENYSMSNWKSINGGLYQVSDSGEVKRLERWITDKLGRKCYRPEMLIKPSINAKGKAMVCLSKPGGGQTTKQAARLIAEAFVPNPLGKACVTHIDGNKANIAAHNLRWSSNAEVRANAKPPKPPKPPTAEQLAEREERRRLSAIEADRQRQRRIRSNAVRLKWNTRKARRELIADGWRVIPGYSDYYASPCGQVASIKRGRRCVLSQVYSRKGYLRVRITGDCGTDRTIAVHRLVALTFVPNPENKPQVNHIDLTRDNNAAENLEWTTSEENNAHARRGLPVSAFESPDRRGVVQALASFSG